MGQAQRAKLHFLDFFIQNSTKSWDNFWQIRYYLLIRSDFIHFFAYLPFMVQNTSSQNKLSQDKFKSGQIVCIESSDRFLYGEVIQIVNSRQLCWARPLTLALVAPTESFSPNFSPVKQSIDLRSASDLLLPLALFRAAYDTEVIELLTELAAKEQPTDKRKLAFDLNGFIKQVCEEKPHQFGDQDNSD